MADMEPVYLSTPGFSSDDPATEGLVMQPIVDENPEEAPEWVEGKNEFGEDAMVPEGSEGDPDAEPVDPSEPSAKKAGDWIAEIEAAQDQSALDAVLEAYAESGKSFKTVDDAADRRQEELDAN